MKLDELEHQAFYWIRFGDEWEIGQCEKGIRFFHNESWPYAEFNLTGSDEPVIFGNVDEVGPKLEAPGKTKEC